MKTSVQPLAHTKKGTIPYEVVVRGEELFQIFAPFYLSDGDGLVIYWKKEGDNWILSDGGHMSMVLSPYGEPSTKYPEKALQYLIGALAQGGIEVKEGVLIHVLRDETVEEALPAYIQGLLELALLADIYPGILDDVIENPELLIVRS